MRQVERYLDQAQWAAVLNFIETLPKQTPRDEGCLTPTAVYLIVKDVFTQAAEALAESDPVTAAVLRRASTHWLRHASASHQADSGTDLRNIQKNLRHASIETTSVYLHTTDDARHRDTTEN